MKTWMTFIVVVLSGVQAIAQSWEFGSDFNVAQPVGGMSKTMNNAIGITAILSRNFKTPFSLGAEMGIGTYGTGRTRQQYTFDDGTTTETNVVVSNDILNFAITGKYFFRNNKKINPYVSGKLGWTWFSTNLTIEDPEDEFSCTPLESEILSGDNTYMASGGAGVRFDFNTFFKKMPARHFYFDLSIHATQGGTVRYMNVEMDPNRPIPDKDVSAKFINSQTQVIHEHHVGYVYTSLLNLIEYRLGIICQTAWK